MQIISLVIFAVLAAVVLYQLYAVLGRKVGRQPGDKPDASKGNGQKAAATDTPASALLNRLRASGPNRDADAATLPPGVALLKSRDGNFDVARFLEGARGAYETIVKAFVSGDRDGLKKLTTTEVYAAFEAAIVGREADGRTETVEFPHPVRADIETATLDEDKARVRVRFLAEFRSRTKDARGEGVDDRRTAEVWTFERPAMSREPVWTLARVDAAEA